MRVVPVIDLKDGVVVRGVAGRREEYRPVVSRLTSSCDPVEVARAFRDRLGLTEMYLADLDAIAGAEPAWGVYEALCRLGCRLWVDAGIRETAQAAALAAAGLERIIVGLETVAGPEVLDWLGRNLGARLMFSLDLKNGLPLGDRAAWGTPDAEEIVRRVLAAGIHRVIVLDLVRVGVGGGTGTEVLCRQLAGQFPQLEIVAGGGVCRRDDLARLQACGVHAVLVASALHDGRLRPEDWLGRNAPATSGEASPGARSCPDPPGPPCRSPSLLDR
jgi:phosphoribosylformimino-5-aminoimidazole carboxamide ribotide isomerase